MILIGMISDKIELMTEQKKDIKIGKENKNKMNKFPVYTEIDVDKLSEILAEQDWVRATSGIPHDDLYEPMVTAIPGTKDVKLEKVVRNYWANVFFSIKENYIRLILSFKK